MAVAPCKSCGGDKPAGQGRRLCDPCLTSSQVREREGRQGYARAYYARNRERLLAQNAEWRDANADHVVAYKRRWHEAAKADGRVLRRDLARYGLTMADYEALFVAQDGVCAICGDLDTRRLNVDHDHATGEVRGLLCSGCNGARLGRLGDSIERAEARAIYYEERARLLRRAIDYLSDPPARGTLKGGES